MSSKWKYIERERQHTVRRRLPGGALVGFKIPFHMLDRDKAVYNDRKISIIDKEEFKRPMGHTVDIRQRGTLRFS